MSVTIVQDTREQAGRHDNILIGFSQFGIKVVRSKLFVGDYTRLDNMQTCIDIKQNLQEVYCNLIQQHDRFRAECVRANENGIRLIILVEQPGILTLADVAKWQNPRAGRYERQKKRGETGKKPPASSEALMKSMVTMTAKYGVQWMFCEKPETAKKICEILRIEV